jgi:outer membrane autotransporter protein
VTKLGGISFSPYGELSYLHTNMDAYTESGGGFPVAYDTLEDDATDLHLGVNASYPLSNKTQLFGLLEGVHRFNDSAAPISGEVIGLFPFALSGEDYNRNWLRFGAGVAARLGPGVASLMVTATTEGEAPSAWLAGTYQVAF